MPAHAQEVEDEDELVVENVHDHVVAASEADLEYAALELVAASEVDELEIVLAYVVVDGID